MECVPGSVRLKDGREQACNKKGRWITIKKEKTIEGGIKRMFPGLTKK